MTVGGEYQVVKKEMKFEIGSAQKRLHSHSLISIIHNTSAKININVLRKFICKAMGKTLHISIKANSNSEYMMSQYVKKNEIIL